LTASESLDFKDVKINALGKFDNAQLEEVVTKSGRLTASIMREVVSLVDTKRHGAFIFASTRAHCQECLDALPRDTSAVITGDTPQEERIKILDAARNGFIKYLININVLTVGIDVPNFDTVVFVRPTESLVLYTQAIGRGLRLYPSKENCLVLDYAGNVERHGDIDSPIINEAIQPKEGQEEDYVIPCYHCKTLNKVLARRCIGMPDNARCDYYFDFKACPHCEVQNDITARQCRSCRGEIIDPNKKLTKSAEKPILVDFEVLRAKYIVSSANNESPVLNAIYTLSQNRSVSEQYYLVSDLAKRTFYHMFAKKHFKEPSKVDRCLNSVRGMQFAINNLDIQTPDMVRCYVRPEGLKIKKKVFREEIN
jgi:DNA repair protein RadD